MNPSPRKRGRPATGQAMSAAERQRLCRERARERQVTGYKELTDAQLVAAIGRELSTAKRSESSSSSRDNAKWHLGRLLAELQGRVSAL